MPDGDRMTARKAVFALLRDFGMTTIFGNPGSTEIPMFRDFPDDFRYILGLQESVVLGMADGYAQASRNAALVNLHSAAGLGHALGNLFTAYRNQTPLVVTAGQQARSILPFDPFLYAERAPEFPRPYVKWSCEPARAQDVPAAIARAYHVAMQPPWGPVFVSIPVDDWDRECAPLAPRRIGTILRGDPALLAEAGRALAVAERPVIIVGAGVARDNAQDELVALAERHQAPVWVAPMSGRSGFPEDHPLFAGFLLAAREKIVASLVGHDLILALGGALSLYHVEGEGPHIPPGAALFQLVDDHAIAAAAPAGTAIITNLKAGIAELLAGPVPAHRSQSVARQPVAPVDEMRLTDALVLQRIAKLRPHGTVIVKEAPTSGVPLQNHLPILEKEGFYAAASGGLGFGLPAAIGIALAQPERKVVAFLGDGASMYAIQGLWTAAQLGLPISFLVANNRRYEAILRFGHLFGVDRPVGTHLPDIDFCALAQGQGVHARRVDVVTDVDAALTESFTADGPTLVEFLVE